MPEIRLSRLPDRTPMKITVTIMPDLHQALHDYAVLYAEAYGSTEPISELIPAMLSSFLESDRAFVRGRTKS